MTITITVDNIETMQPDTIRRISGLFGAIADYADLCSVPPPVLKPEEGKCEAESEAKGTAPFTVADVHQGPIAHPPVGVILPQPPIEEAVPAIITPVVPLAINAGIEVDSQGFPWDGRIHSATRSKVADGSWRQKRNLDPDILAQVTNELRQTMGLTPVDIIPSVPAVPMSPFAGNAVPPVPQVNTMVETVSAGAVQTVSHSEGVNLFPQFMQKVTAAFAAKTLDQATISSAVQQVGLPSLPMLNSHPHLVTQVASILGITL